MTAPTSGGSSMPRSSIEQSSNESKRALLVTTTATTTTTNVTSTARATPATLVAVTVVLVVWSTLVPPVLSTCPAVCTCRWKGGKETTECVGKALQVIPPGIDVGTQVLDMTGNNLQLLPKDVFLRNGLLNLQKMYLANCKLAQIDRQAFTRLNNLVELDVGGNVLPSVPSEALAGVPELRRLVLSGNPIQKIEPAAFEVLKTLQVLELADCQLEIVADGAFSGLPRLQQLKLNGNRLRTLTAAVLKDVGALNTILLTENPWVCDCHSRQMRLWLSSSGVPYYISPQCFDPPRLKGFDLDKLIPEDFACAPTSAMPQQYVLQIQRGTNVSLECRVRADPEAFVYWLGRDNNNVIGGNTNGSLVAGGAAGGGTTQVLTDLDERTYVVEETVMVNEKVSVLIMESVDNRDAGQYACVAENRGGRLTVNFTLEVLALPVKQQAPVVLNKGFLMGVVIGLGVLALLVLVLVCVLVVKICQSHGRRRRKRRQKKLPRSETQETKGSISCSNNYDSQNESGNEKQQQTDRSINANPVQKPPRSFANATYVSTSEISLHDYSQQSKDGVGGMVVNVSGLDPGAHHHGISVIGSNGGVTYGIKPDIIKMDGGCGGDSGEYSIPRGCGQPAYLNGGGNNGAAVSPGGSSNQGIIYQNTDRWSGESPVVVTCHGCGDHSGSCLGVPCLMPRAYGAGSEGDGESDRSSSYRAANVRPTASGLAGQISEEYGDAEEWPRPPPPLYDTVKKPVPIASASNDCWNNTLSRRQQQQQQQQRAPQRLQDEAASCALANYSPPPPSPPGGGASGPVWERQSPSTAAATAASLLADFPQDLVGVSLATVAAGSSSSSAARSPQNQNNVHLKNSPSSSSNAGLSPFPLLNLSTVRDSPDEGYEDEGEEGTEMAKHEKQMTKYNKDRRL